MEIVWDEPKRETNLTVHRIDFVDVAEDFDFSVADVSETYGDRFKATGFLGENLVTVIFSLLGAQALSIISARPASRKERTAYENR